MQVLMSLSSSGGAQQEVVLCGKARIIRTVNQARPSKCTYMTERLENLQLTNPDEFIRRTIPSRYWCFLDARYGLYTDFPFVNHMVILILLMRELRSSG